MTNYTDIPGVHASEWPEDSDEPNWDDRDAMIEELYYEDYRGRLVLTIKANDKLYSFAIPIVAQTDWNEFADSLPRWEV